MTYSKISFILLISSLLIFTGCDKDDDSPDKTTPDNFLVSSVSGEEGCNLKITTNGVTEDCISDRVFGWESGNLLGSRRFKQIRTGCSGNNFAFRISMPPSVVFDDIAVDEHVLNSTRLLLQNTSSLEAVYPEFYVNSLDPELPGNATGTIEIRRNLSTANGTYSLIGNIDATFYKNGVPVTVKGQFWSKEANW